MDDYDDIRTAIAEALMYAKVNGSPVHEHLGDLMRSLMEYVTPTLREHDAAVAAHERAGLRAEWQELLAKLEAAVPLVGDNPSAIALALLVGGSRILAEPDAGEARP